MYGLRRAVVVGINHYEKKTETELLDLSGAEHDAQEIWDTLINSERGGFSEEKSHLLIGKDAKCSKIREALSDVFYRTEKCELALFYFAGHGRELDFYNEGYIAPFDFSCNDPIVQGIAMSELRRIISRSYGPERVNCAVSILDCCYSGIVTEVTRGKKRLNPQQKFKEHLDVAQDKGVVLIASSGKDQESIEIPRAHKNDDGSYHAHGALTYYLLKAFDGEASGSEGSISLESLFKYARDKLESDKKQMPLISINESVGPDRIFIARLSEKTKKVIQENIQYLNDKYKSDNPNLVIYQSIPRTARILKYDSRHPVGMTYRNKIINDIKNFGEPCNWLANYLFDIEPEIPYVAEKLKKIVDFGQGPFNPNFDGLANLDQYSLKLLTALFIAVVRGGETIDEFLQYCRPVEDLLKSQSCQLQGVSIQ